MRTVATDHHSNEALRGAPAAARVSLFSPIVLWAIAGGFFTCFSFAVFAQWVLSPQAFAAIPLAADDVMDGRTLIMLHAIEILSTSVAVGAFYFYLLRPWLRTGTPTLAGLLLIGALITYVLDTTVNYNDYYMAWNKHAFNFGTWAAGFPGHSGPTRYAEAWFWGPPMYVYFGVALGSIQLKVFDVLRERVGFAITIAVALAVAFIFDFVAESTIIQVSQAYAWPFTISALSVWSGTQFQFPLYESMLVMIYASLYALLLNSARNNDTSFIERGLDRLPSGFRLPTRLLAATGFAAICTAIYFGGFLAISQFADSRVTMPSYLMYVDGNWDPTH